jgi:DNA (cytosine-5)-methyltransferase 1
MSKLTAIDLFAGAGGLTLAAQNLGIRVLAAVENSKHAGDTYHLNFIQNNGKTPPKLFRRDILRLPPKRLMSELGLKVGDLDILMGGPPCQGYSRHRIKGAGVDDPRNKLLLRYFKFVRALRPKAFIVENVPGLLWPRHAKYLAAFKRHAKKAGYILSEPTVLNARDYGVPQNRKRVFILGRRTDLGVEVEWPPLATHFAPSSDQVLKGGCPTWPCASDVFAAPLPANDPNAVHMKSSKTLTAVFARTPKNGGSRKDSGRTLRCHRRHDGHSDVYGRIDPSKPGPTMTTACINPSKGRFVHPRQNHGITLRHAARFQCFPDMFVFEGGLMAGGVQVGNAVPIRLGTAVLGLMGSAIRS